MLYNACEDSQTTASMKVFKYENLQTTTYMKVYRQSLILIAKSDTGNEFQQLVIQQKQKQTKKQKYT